MPTPLDRLIYRSVSTRPTHVLANLVELLGEAERNNARTGLTGALAVHGDRFLQVIEGDPGVLDVLLRRLERDARHRDIVLLDRSRITQRRFEGWNMASARITPDLAPELEALMNAPAPSPDRLVTLMLEAVGRL
ncbi:MAG: BLUF domain-containing protein [Brevundimonas sp.]|nr:MAG: BLUF domain-containing protein [Brevundimonas sp.]